MPRAADPLLRLLVRSLLAVTLAAGLWCGLWTMLWTGPAAAHESRPAYLEIRELAEGRYDLLWRTPRLSGMPLPVVLQLPEGVTDAVEPMVQILPDSRLERRRIEAADGLFGARLSFVGLEATITDVVVHTKWQDGATATHIVRPAEPFVILSSRQDARAVFTGYLALGIEHILGGIDHLVFVFVLVLLISDRGRLVGAVTAFTAAHSLSLAAATLGWVVLPAAPVEAVVALSIAFLAAELAKPAGRDMRLTERHPWIVAFGFGLLHGLGFARALLDIGLPTGEVPMALLSFNLGVEAGQLLFIALVLVVGAFLARLYPMMMAAAGRRGGLALGTTSYMVGGVAAYWFFARAATL